jgi:putative ABC transport system substrate-binding protein
MRRRDFISLLGGAAAWPLAARAQQPAMPVVGWISPDAPDLLQAFREGLKETGYIEHEDIAIEFRPVQNQIDRLPEFAADLVRRKVNVIVVGNTASALAVKAATTTIPVVFNTPGDPVTLGIVTNLARPERFRVRSSVPIRADSSILDAPLARHTTSSGSSLSNAGATSRSACISLNFSGHRG